MGVVDNLLSLGVGYLLSEASESHPVRDFCNLYFSDKTIEDIVDEYAQKKLDIYGSNNDFARRLHEIAKRYEGYDYNED